ncbi:MAG: hypothetical protein R3B70_49225, partial [Polyangiaceae bacterium]
VETLLADREAEVGPEVDALEAALRDRGHRVAQLTRDLRESERIGRELLSELLALRAAHGEGGGDDDGGALNGQGTPSSGGGMDAGLGGAHAGAAQAGAAHAGAAQARGSDIGARAGGGMDVLSAGAYQHRIDALAADAAQKQAELLATTWKLQAMERELTEARSAMGDPSATERELSGALVRAQSEIADLRRALSQTGADAGGVPRAVVEDAVLLHQQMGR